MVKGVSSIRMDRNILEISNSIEKVEKEFNLTPRGKFCTMEILERISNTEKEKRFGSMEALLKEALCRTSKKAMDWPT